MSELLIFGLAFAAFLLVSMKLQVIRLLCGTPLRPPLGQVVESSELPPEVLAQYQAVAERLLQVGFELSHFERRQDLAETVETPHWVMVLRHPTVRAFCELSVPTSPDIANRVAILFISFHDAADLLTRHEPTVLFDQSTESVLINIDDAADVVKRWQSHVAFLDSSEVSGRSSGEGQLPTAQDYPHRMKGAQWRYLDELRQNGVLVQQGEKYRTRLTAALSVLAGLPRRQREDLTERRARFEEQLNTGEKSTEDLAALEANAFLRQEQLVNNSRFDTKTKSILFLLSVAAFSLIFGFVFSWSYLLVLFPVLLFHELGHILAMKLLGYRDLQILFMPLGAVAIGKESETYRPWKEVVVLLAGPVPGIVLAFAAILFWHDQPEWVESLVIVSLVLNYLNLLPMMPLDGGRLVHLALFSRYGIGALFFKAGSAIMFAVGAWAFSDPVLVLLALIMAYFCFTEIATRRTLRLSQVEFDKLVEIENPVQRAFAALNETKTLFNEKYVLIRQLAPEFDTPNPAVTTRLVTLFLYLGILIGPAFGAYGYLYQSFNPESFEQESVKYEPGYWQTAIATETDPEKKADLMLEGARWLGLADEDRQREDWLVAAAQIAQDSGNSELLSQSTLDLLSFQVQNNNADAALNTYQALLAQPEVDATYIESATYLLSALDDLELAYPFLAKNLGFAKKSGDAWAIMHNYMELANNHLDRNQPEYANHFVTLAVELSESDENIRGYASSYFSAFYVATGEFEKAEASVNKALAVALEDVESYSVAELRRELGWLDLLQNDIASAGAHFAKADRDASLARQASLDEIGFVGRMMLGDEALETWNERHFTEWEYQLVIAHARADWDDYQEARSRLVSEFGSQAEVINWYQSMLSERKRDTFATLRNKLILRALKQDSVV